MIAAGEDPISGSHDLKRRKKDDGGVLKAGSHHAKLEKRG